MSAFENLYISCQDGYSLAAQFYPQTGNTQQPLPILLCPATGITKKFYHHFCLWLSQQGYDVLVFDFRGIGDSLHGELHTSQASIVQWGQLDIPAALAALLMRTQASQVILLGHSAGGQLLGINPLYQKVAKVVAIAGSTGYIKGLNGRTKFLAPVMFKLLFPLARHTLGYGPTQAIGMGENLPKDVAREWAQFCSQPGYVMNAIGKSIQPTEQFHEQIRCPMTVLCGSDDEIATPVNVQDLLRLYPHAMTQHIELKPHHYGHKSIGHMALFKPSHQNLWPIIKQHLSV